METAIISLSNMNCTARWKNPLSIYTPARVISSGALNSVNDELSKLFIHIRDFGEKLFEEKNISFRAYNEVKEKDQIALWLQPGGESNI